MDKRIPTLPKKPKVFRLGFYLNLFGFRFFVGILGNEIETNEDIYVEDI